MKLSEIRKHVLFPFSDFRENDASFLLLELLWTAVAKEALGEELSNICVPLSIAEQDKEYLGNPTMLDFWVPKIKKGAKVLLNENIHDLPLYSQKHQKDDGVFFPLYVSASMRERPEEHYFPTNDLIDERVNQFGELLFISDLSDEAIDGVIDGLRLFITTDITVDEMSKKCVDYEQSIGALKRPD